VRKKSVSSMSLRLNLMAMALKLNLIIVRGKAESSRIRQMHSAV
jgi:hypothetical protein